MYIDDDNDGNGPPDTKKFQGETPMKPKGNFTSQKLTNLINFQSHKGKKEPCMTTSIVCDSLWNCGHFCIRMAVSLTAHAII